MKTNSLSAAMQRAESRDLQSNESLVLAGSGVPLTAFHDKSAAAADLAGDRQQRVMSDAILVGLPR